MTSAITQIERARGFLEAARLSDDWVREMGNQALIKEAHHTTHIEGTRLTLDQAERLWKGEIVPEADPDDTRELLNYRSAFEFVSQCLDSGDPISEGMIREIHRKLVEGVRGGKAAPGEYRRIQNYVANSVTGEVIYTPPSAFEIPIMMSEMVRWFNSDLEIHPVLISGIAQFQWFNTRFIFTRSLTVMDGRLDCCQPYVFIRQGMISSVCSPLVNIMIVTDPLSTKQSKVFEKTIWI